MLPPLRRMFGTASILGGMYFLLRSKLEYANRGSLFVFCCPFRHVFEFWWIGVDTSATGPVVVVVADIESPQLVPEA